MRSARLPEPVRQDKRCTGPEVCLIYRDTDLCRDRSSDLARLWAAGTGLGGMSSNQSREDVGLSDSLTASLLEAQGVGGSSLVSPAAFTYTTSAGTTGSMVVQPGGDICFQQVPWGCVWGGWVAGARRRDRTVRGWRHILCWVW